MMARKYRGSEVPRPFNPATIKRMIEVPMPTSNDEDTAAQQFRLLYEGLLPWRHASPHACS
jgi:hypothetical protein